MSVALNIVLFIAIVLLMSVYILDIAFSIGLIWGLLKQFIDLFCFLWTSPLVITSSYFIISSVLLFFVISKVYSIFWKHS